MKDVNVYYRTAKSQALYTIHLGRLTKTIIIINPTYLLRSTKSKYTGTTDKTKTNATADVCGFANKGEITRQQDTTNMTTGIPIHTL